jgi:hypothetical protein
MVYKRQDGDYNHMIAMLRCMKALDPDAYMEIPEHYKVGLKSEEHFHLVAAERTQEKVAARVTVITSVTPATPAGRVFHGLPPS